MNEPTALGHIAIHDTVENILSDVPPGRLLDVPAGEGFLAKRLAKHGFDVSCCDLYPQIFRLEGIENRQGNLDSTLPYDDQSFDHIVCVEGLEHIENPANAIREFSRLLKSDGDLIVSVPNVMNIEERLKWLFFGYTSHFKPLSAEARKGIADVLDSKDFDGMDEVAYHVTPLGYSELRFLLEKNRFVIEGLFVDKHKKNSWAFMPLIALIRMISKFTGKAKRKERWTDELNSREVLTGGNTLIFKAKKV